MHYKAKNIIYIALFTALIYVSGLIRVQVLSVPFTLQTMAVMLAACFLGLKRSLFAVSAYIIMGLAGLPVFSKGGGIFYVLELSFGYILSFLFLAAITGAFKDRVKNNFTMLFLLLCAVSVSGLLIGAAYAFVLLEYTSGSGGAAAIFSSFFLAFIPAEIIKSLASALIYYRLKGISVIDQV
jgi:biotin transport system substrate-specific component